MKVKYFMLILIQCFSVFSCSLSEKKQVGLIDEVVDGVYQVRIELKAGSSGWNIHIGNPLSGGLPQDLIKKSIENNEQIIGESLSLTIINHNKRNLSVWAESGEFDIPYKSKFIYFNGTLEDLISNTRPIKLNSFGKTLYFTLEFRFENKQIIIKEPIVIMAERHDNL